MILPELSLVLDILIACLLVAVIVYAVRLNRNLSVLQQSKSELEKMLSGFTESTEKAEQAIQRVKEASTQNRDSLGKLLSEAETLREDLAYMIDRGSSLADKLEGGLAQHRAPAETNGGAEPRGLTKPRAATGQNDDIENAMRAARQAASAPTSGARKPLAAMPGDRDAATGSTLPATTNKDAGGNTGTDPESAGKPKSKSALLRALQGMR